MRYKDNQLGAYGVGECVEYKEKLYLVLSVDPVETLCQDIQGRKVSLYRSCKIEGRITEEFLEEEAKAEKIKEPPTIKLWEPFKVVLDKDGLERRATLILKDLEFIPGPDGMTTHVNLTCDILPLES